MLGEAGDGPELRRCSRCRHPHLRVAPDDEGAAAHRLPRLDVHRDALAGEGRGVDAQRIGRYDLPIGDDAIPLGEQEQVTRNDIAGGNLDSGAIANDPGYCRQ